MRMYNLYFDPFSLSLRMMFSFFTHFPRATFNILILNGLLDMMKKSLTSKSFRKMSKPVEGKTRKTKTDEKTDKSKENQTTTRMTK